MKEYNHSPLSYIWRACKVNTKLRQISPSWTALLTTDLPNTVQIVRHSAGTTTFKATCSSELGLFVCMMTKIVIDMFRAITPLSLFGTDRRIAYANRKYHSGWRCTGVAKGSAGMKLSGSLKMYGSFRVNISTAIIVTANPRLFFTVK